MNYTKGDFMKTTEKVIPPETARAGGKRWWRWCIPAVIVALAAANLARVRGSSDLDSNFKSMQSMLTIAASVLLLVLWFVLLSGLRWRVRLIGLGALILLAVGLRQSLRFDGSIDGTGRPNIVWRWAPRKSGEVGNLKMAGNWKEPTKFQADADYPGYLGRDRSGVIEGIQLERDWVSHPPKELWRQSIGLGWSGFAISGAGAITQEQRGEKEMVVCYELTTGRAIWSHTNRVRFGEPMGGDGPRATPTIDGGRVYVLGATGILDCLAAATGRRIWTRDTLRENGLPNIYFGKSSSPLLVDDLVVVTGGMTNSSTVLAFRQSDGSPAWRAGKDKASFSSPALVTLGGRRQILSVNAASVTAHDPKDGQILWEYPWANDKWPKCAQPVVLAGDRVFVSASFNAGCVLLQVKVGSNGNFSATEVWKNRNMKSEFSNMVARGGFLYGLDDGILACLELDTGQRKWKDGRYGHGQLLLVGDLLLVQTEPGPVTLVEANPAAYREVGRISALGAKTWNTPALAGEFLLVRNDQEAVCYKLTKRDHLQVEN